MGSIMNNDRQRFISLMVWLLAVKREMAVFEESHVAETPFSSKCNGLTFQFDYSIIWPWSIDDILNLAIAYDIRCLKP